MSADDTAASPPVEIAPYAGRKPLLLKGDEPMSKEEYVAQLSHADFHPSGGTGLPVGLGAIEVMRASPGVFALVVEDPEFIAWYEALPTEPPASAPAAPAVEVAAGSSALGAATPSGDSAAPAPAPAAPAAPTRTRESASSSASASAPEVVDANRPGASLTVTQTAPAVIAGGSTAPPIQQGNAVFAGVQLLPNRNEIIGFKIAKLKLSFGTKELERDHGFLVQTDAVDEMDAILRPTALFDEIPGLVGHSMRRASRVFTRGWYIPEVFTVDENISFFDSELYNTGVMDQYTFTSPLSRSRIERTVRRFYNHHDFLPPSLIASGARLSQDGQVDIGQMTSAVLAGGNNLTGGAIPPFYDLAHRPHGPRERASASWRIVDPYLLVLFSLSKASMRGSFMAPIDWVEHLFAQELINEEAMTYYRRQVLLDYTPIDHASVYTADRVQILSENVVYAGRVMRCEDLVVHLRQSAGANRKGEDSQLTNLYFTKLLEITRAASNVYTSVRGPEAYNPPHPRAITTDARLVMSGLNPAGGAAFASAMTLWATGGFRQSFRFIPRSFEGQEIFRSVCDAANLYVLRTLTPQCVMDLEDLIQMVHSMLFPFFRESVAPGSETVREWLARFRANYHVANRFAVPDMDKLVFKLNVLEPSSASTKEALIKASLIEIITQAVNRQWYHVLRSERPIAKDPSERSIPTPWREDGDHGPLYMFLTSGVHNTGARTRRDTQGFDTEAAHFIAYMTNVLTVYGYIFPVKGFGAGLIWMMGTHAHVQAVTRNMATMNYTIELLGAGDCRPPQFGEVWLDHELIGNIEVERTGALDWYFSLTASSRHEIATALETDESGPDEIGFFAQSDVGMAGLSNHAMLNIRGRALASYVFGLFHDQPRVLRRYRSLLLQFVEEVWLKVYESFPSDLKEFLEFVSVHFYDTGLDRSSMCHIGFPLSSMYDAHDVYLQPPVAVWPGFLYLLPNAITTGGFSSSIVPHCLDVGKEGMFPPEIASDARLVARTGLTQVMIDAGTSVDGNGKMTTHTPWGQTLWRLSEAPDRPGVANTMFGKALATGTGEVSPLRRNMERALDQVGPIVSPVSDDDLYNKSPVGKQPAYVYRREMKKMELRRVILSRLPVRLSTYMLPGHASDGPEAAKDWFFLAPNLAALAPRADPDGIGDLGVFADVDARALAPYDPGFGNITVHHRFLHANRLFEYFSERMLFRPQYMDPGGEYSGDDLLMLLREYAADKGETDRWLGLHFTHSMNGLTRNRSMHMKYKFSAHPQTGPVASSASKLKLTIVAAALGAEESQDLTTVGGAEIEIPTWSLPTGHSMEQRRVALRNQGTSYTHEVIFIEDILNRSVHSSISPHNDKVFLQDDYGSTRPATVNLGFGGAHIPNPAVTLASRDHGDRPFSFTTTSDKTSANFGQFSAGVGPHDCPLAVSVINVQRDHQTISYKSSIPLATAVRPPDRTFPWTARPQAMLEARNNRTD